MRVSTVFFGWLCVQKISYKSGWGSLRLKQGPLKKFVCDTFFLDGPKAYSAVQKFYIHKRSYRELKYVFKVTSTVEDRGFGAKDPLLFAKHK